MLKWTLMIIAAAILSLGCVGCAELGLIASGAGAATAGNALKENAEKRKVELEATLELQLLQLSDKIAANEVLFDRLEQAADEVERDVIRAEIIAAREQLAAVRAGVGITESELIYNKGILDALPIAGQLVDTDWTTGEGIMAGAVSLVTLASVGFGAFEKRKRIEADASKAYYEKQYEDHKKGAEWFMRDATKETANKLYKSIGAARAGKAPGEEVRSNG